MQQEVLLAMLAKEPSHGSQLQARLDRALGPLAGTMNAGHIYVQLGRLERTGLVALQEPTAPNLADRGERKVYELTPAGQERVALWLSEVSWPKPDLAEFHLKLITAAQGRLADPITIIDIQRRELLRRLRDAQRAAMDPDAQDQDSMDRDGHAGSPAGLLLEGIVLRLQADLHWLEACERRFTESRRGSRHHS